MEGGGEEEAPAAPAAAAQVQLCGAYQQPNEGRAHSCAQCNVNLHSHILCTALWMPIDGVYFCSRSCLGSYNDWAPTLPAMSSNQSVSVPIRPRHHARCGLPPPILLPHRLRLPHH